MWKMSWVYIEWILLSHLQYPPHYPLFLIAVHTLKRLTAAIHIIRLEQLLNIISTSLYRFKELLNSFINTHSFFIYQTHKLLRFFSHSFLLVAYAQKLLSIMVVEDSFSISWDDATVFMIPSDMNRIM